MENETQNSNFNNPILSAVFSLIMRNLEFIPLTFALQVWFDAGNRWEYWATIILVGMCSGVSTSYNKHYR